MLNEEGKRKFMLFDFAHSIIYLPVQVLSPPPFFPFSSLPSPPSIIHTEINR